MFVNTLLVTLIINYRLIQLLMPNHRVSSTVACVLCVVNTNCEIQWSPLNCILFKGIFWLMEYNFKVQNRLYSFTIVISLLKGILFKGIFWIKE